MTLIAKILRLTAFGAVAAWASATASACVLVTTSGPGIVSYDPISSYRSLTPFQVFIENTCETPANDAVEVWFSDDIEPEPFSQIGNVPFQIANLNREVLSSPVSSVVNPSVVQLRSRREVVQYDFILAPGRRADSAVRRLNLNWRAADDAGIVMENSIEFSIGIEPETGFSIALDNGLQSGSLDFGVLSPGESMAVGLVTKSTQPYQIEFASDYRNQLRLSETCGLAPEEVPDPLEAIDYQARIDGMAVTDILAYRAPRGRSQNIVAMPHQFEVQIDPTLDPSQKRAGRYCEIITLTIRPAN